MKKKTTLHSYDSDEEWHFSLYADELFEYGYIDNYQSHLDSYFLSTGDTYFYNKQLKTKSKIVVKKLINEHIYTPDFQIMWNEKARGVFFNHVFDKVDLKNIPFIVSKPFCLVEVKPVFDQNNMTRLFSVNQKWMYQRHGIYCQKIIPVSLFERTFTPKRYLQTDKSGKPRKLKYTPRSLEEYLCQRTLSN